MGLVLDHRIGLRALVAVDMVGHMKWGTLIALDMEVRGCEFPRFTRASECTAIEESCDTFGAIAGDSDRRAPGSPRMRRPPSPGPRKLNPPPAQPFLTGLHPEHPTTQPARIVRTFVCKHADLHPQACRVACR